LEHGADLACGPFENTCLKEEEKKKKTLHLLPLVQQTTKTTASIVFPQETQSGSFP
jgi:hypothetical protein